LKNYTKKVSKTLITGLAILAVALLVYLMYPKYQVRDIKNTGRQVLITKTNTITGETSLEWKRIPKQKKY